MLFVCVRVRLTFVCVMCCDLGFDVACSGLIVCVVLVCVVVMRLRGLSVVYYAMLYGLVVVVLLPCCCACDVC